MSILKSILHRYNTTNQNYDTLHPETEHAQVTDFGQGVIAHLASSTLVSLVTSVSTGSVFGKMVEKLLEASGVQYNFTNANAWYICLGSLFGGLIIQGGKDSFSQTETTVAFPISYFEIPAMGVSNGGFYLMNWSRTQVTVVKRSSAENPYLAWLTIGH